LQEGVSVAEVTVRSLVVQYGTVAAVDGVSFTVKEGEFLTLLGPSGCGKSTTLAAIAGLERPNSGLISVGDIVFFDSARSIWLEPEARSLGLVFQSYALWPHMTIEENCAFPLRLRKIGREERLRRIREALELVDMAAYASRYPHQLSGGQQQRAALARTLVYQPRVLLLDEPLSNLDAKLRDRARSWLKDLQNRVGITTIYVTHDQVEALALSDRIAVMNEGKIVQLDAPRVIYESPDDPFVADFIGTTTFLPATLQIDGKAVLSDGQSLGLPSHGRSPLRGSVNLAIRPERVRIVGAEVAETAAHVNATIKSKSYLGGRFAYDIALAGTVLKVESDKEHPTGDVNLAIDPNALIVFPA
jgi:iron(III) transport system ATP-binding protein